MRRCPDIQQFWRQSLCSCGPRTMEQSSIAPERGGLTVQPISAVAKDIFVWIVGHGAVWTILIAPHRNDLTYLLTYLLYNSYYNLYITHKQVTEGNIITWSEKLGGVSGNVRMPLPEKSSTSSSIRADEKPPKPSYGSTSKWKPCDNAKQDH